MLGPSNQIFPLPIFHFFPTHPSPPPHPPSRRGSVPEIVVWFRSRRWHGCRLFVSENRFAYYKPRLVIALVRAMKLSANHERLNDPPRPIAEDFQLIWSLEKACLFSRVQSRITDSSFDQS
ncbi:hypothetical protein Hamer_G023795 [Homarus americanus]|uniref:Uncharacterized protein n=1 Tax=Homarus americanus TaxID=6706 RepID=A0A8J5NDN2_HOMAM|nr:hypothetical protein Hamer_G023795 [Homarus americanus]